MPKLTDALNTFKTGDVIRMGVSPALHMSIFVRAEHSPIQQHAIVHVAEQVVVEPTDQLYQENTNFIPPYVHYGCPDSGMGKAAARIAVGWADTTRRVTPYGSTPDPKPFGGTAKTSKVNRFGAMVTTASLDAIPFELNALIRVVKWVHKAEQATAPLSENRGATCSAFVGSCYQTACLQKYFQIKNLLWNIGRAYEIAAGLVETKEQARQRRQALPALPGSNDIHARTGYASREHSNKRLKDDTYAGKSIEEQWEQFFKAFYRASCYCEYTKKVPEISQIIPAAFFYDVKYINALLLSDALVQAGWKATTYDAF